MRRDFSDENKEQLLAIIDKIESEHEPAYFDWRSDIWFWILRLFMKKPADDNEEAYAKYYRQILDMHNYTREMIVSMFIQANHLDALEAASGAILEACAVQVSDKIKELIAITTEANLQAWTDANINVETHELNDTGIVITRNPPAISDEAWITICLKEVFSPFYSFSSLTPEFLGQIGLWDAFLISLFNWPEILTADILDTPGAADLKKQIAKYVLDGEDGYKTIKDLAKALGVSEDEARNLLKEYLSNGLNGRKPTLQYGVDPRDAHSDLILDVRQRDIIRQFLADNVEIALKDDAMFEKLCLDMGMDPQIAHQVINHEIAGYDVHEYMEGIADTLKYLDSENALDVSMPSAAKKANQAKKIASILYSNLYAQEDSSFTGLNLEQRLKNAGLDVNPKDALKQYWSDGTLSQAEAAEFLNKYRDVLGLPADVDPEAFQHVSGLMRDLSTAGKVYKGASNTIKAVDYISYVFQDYEQQLAVIEQLRASAGPNAEPAYIEALNRLQTEYESKVQRAFSKGLDIAINVGVDKAISSWPAAAAVQTAIDLAGTMTGASGHADAASDILKFNQTAAEMNRCYEEAVAFVREGHQTPEDVMRVRMTFESTRQAYLKLLNAEVSYSKGYIGSWDDKKDKIAYLEYQIDALKNMQPGEDLQLMSFDDFMKL